MLNNIKELHMEGGDTAGQNKDKGNGEINKTAPFGLVKEAVALFEERVHAADVDHVTRVQSVRYVIFMYCNINGCSANSFQD